MYQNKFFPENGGFLSVKSSSIVNRELGVDARNERFYTLRRAFALQPPRRRFLRWRTTSGGVSTCMRRNRQRVGSRDRSSDRRTPMKVRRSRNRKDILILSSPISRKCRHRRN